jgi:hypothetical protein
MFCLRRSVLSYSQQAKSMAQARPFFAGMDSQVDVSIHTLVQLAPGHLYFHIKAVELLVWEPWTSQSEAQFSLLLMV